jgi:hypothetical protein
MLPASVDDSAHARFYVYDWPDLVDKYPKYTDRDIRDHGVEFPAWSQHFGSGRSIYAEGMEHKTSQFALFKLMYVYERTRSLLLPIIRHLCATFDPLTILAPELTFTA